MYSAHGLPDAYRSSGPVLDLFSADPWPLEDDVFADIAAGIPRLIGSAPPAWKALRSSAPWTGAGSALASDVSDAIYLALGPGAIAAGTVVNQLLHLLDPWTAKPYGTDGPWAVARNTGARLPGGTLLEAL